MSDSDTTIHSIMSSLARQAYEANREDINQLWEIHQEYGGKGVGAKHGVEVLNRATIIFITASWESWVEDFARQCFDALLQHAQTADVIPVKVRNYATRPLFDQKDSRRVWDLADAGWRSVLITHRDAILNNWLGPFNTPKTQQVKLLFEELLGINDVTQWWRWKGMTPRKVGDKLDRYITLRGNIAHRVKDAEPVYKNDGYDYHAHVRRIIDVTEHRMWNYLKSLIGTNPW